MRILSLLLISLGLAAAAPVDFNREIRPILSDRCFACHGPDQSNRKSKLRLDTEAGARADLGGHFGIVAGSTAKSTVYQRIVSKNNALRMPPQYMGHAALSEREVAAIGRWIEEGAKWQGHWSLIVPVRPEAKTVSSPAWVRNPIDNFVLARLDREGLKPSPEAARESLLRRVSFDLTGLPPSPAEIEAFVKDTSPGAYEKVVDRLLASPRYGERMAARWLDAARYADTNGYQTDAERFMWRWRDWVIDAFNKNMPFDRFTVEQLAGDLLPNPTMDQLIATGFNRNHRGNGEGGSIAEEFAVEYVVDRVETTSTVWMGLTLGCARCHDHKYDPFAQKDFYSLYAFFNNIPEKGKVFKYGNSPPMIPAPTRDQQTTMAGHENRLRTAASRMRELEPAIEAAQRDWEKSVDKAANWSPGESLLAQFNLDGDVAGADRSNKPVKATAKGGTVAFEAGRHGQAGVFDGKSYVDAGLLAPFGFYSKFSLAAWVYPVAGDGAIVARSLDVDEGTGYGLYLKNGKLQVNLVQRWLDDCLRVESEKPVALNQWSHVAMTYDASRVADGIKVYVNGAPVKLVYIVDDLNQSFQAKEPLRIGAGNGLRFHGRIDDVRVYNDVLTPAEAAVLSETSTLSEIASMRVSARTPAQKDKLRWAFLDRYAPPAQREAWKQLHDAAKRHEFFRDSVPTVMVMQELPYIRDAHVLIRGSYDRPGEKVARAVPAALPALPANAPRNRLGLAEWLVSKDHPLTARVTVNRFWQMVFGTGIVKTVEDFGSQGEWPVHPELLDWLAVEFRESGWDVKRLMKTMVMSATYRQSSKVTPEALRADPENRLLARAPRLRLAPEMVRDQALAMSGLLVEKLGGPSVKPYQPAGLWKELSGGADYQKDQGDNLWRRSMYTFWKRAVPPPGMMTFDSAGREACMVRESRTNTPLQALTLMNDVTYLEAARKMAERMMTEGGASTPDRLSYGFLLAMARRPNAREQRVLETSYHRTLDRYRTDAAAAQQFLEQGDAPRRAGLDQGELAAYATVASMLMNLDEAVTKE